MSVTPEHLYSLTILCCLEEIIVVVGHCIRIPSSTFTQHAGPTIGICIHSGDINGATGVIVGAPPLHILVWVVVRQRHLDSVLTSLSLQFLFLFVSTQNVPTPGKKAEPNLHVINSSRVCRTGFTIANPLAAEFVFDLHQNQVSTILNLIGCQ